MGTKLGNLKNLLIFKKMTLFFMYYILLLLWLSAELTCAVLFKVTQIIIGVFIVVFFTFHDNCLCFRLCFLFHLTVLRFTFRENERYHSWRDVHSTVVPNCTEPPYHNYYTMMGSTRSGQVAATIIRSFHNILVEFKLSLLI